MKRLAFLAVAASILSLCLLVIIGGKIISLFVKVPIAVAQVVSSITPKVVQTDTQVVVFENPLVDEEGLSVDEVVARRAELLGKSIVVKGALTQVDKVWGFTMEDTSQDRSQLFVITRSGVAGQAASDFTLAGQKYLRIRGTLKEMVWTDEDSSRIFTLPSQNSDTRRRRLVLVADELSSIAVHSE